MRKKILSYKNRIDRMLQDPPEDINYEEEQRKHLIQIQFFMHERLVHEIVMVLFALITVMVFLAVVMLEKMILVVLLAALLVLLIPYIMHYYVLENSVQYMYEQYDEMERRKHQAG
ncbi:MAG: hypothetical protein IJ079_10290 [Lachnospiraceae bacterium]|nr:hypothetical protein [Lachnospiraceae bacterium]